MLHLGEGGGFHPTALHFRVYGILADNDFSRYAVIIEQIGGIQHETYFENTRRPARCGTRYHNMVICVSAEPFLSRVWRCRDAARYLRRYYYLHELGHNRNHRSRDRFPRQPLRPAHAGGVAIGTDTAVAVRNSGQNLRMKSASVYDTITISS